MIELLFLAVIGAVAVVLARAYVRRMAIDADRYAFWQDRFFMALDRLLDNRDTPAIIIKVGMVLGEDMRSRPLLTALLWSIISGHARDPHSEMAQTIQSLPERVSHDFSSLMVSWLHALSHTSVIRGYVLRNLMFPIFKKKNGGEQNWADVDQAVVRPFGETAISVSKHRHAPPLVPA